MKSALVLSILVKAVGAVLEIVNQILITRLGGVELFGEFSFYVSVLEIVCWCLFSGIVKVNAFYVSQGKDIGGYRRRFFVLFALPVVILLSLAGAAYSLAAAVAVAGAFLYGLQLDLSSVFLACRRYKVSLFGEYLVSRAFMCACILVLAAAGSMCELTLTCAYALSFLASALFFYILKGGLPECGAKLSGGEGKGLARKQANFQLTDVANGLVNQAPVIVQYAFAGAFQAGVLSVVLVAKKVMSFVAGPTAKVYLPEFARRYARGDMAGLRAVYREIVLLQMCFVLPIALVMVGAPEAILSVYNAELVEYREYLRLAAAVFLVMVMFGPQGNLLSMVGRESLEAATKWVSLAAMVAVMVLTFGSDLFVLYGIAAQVFVDSFLKLFFLVRALGGFPLGVRDCFKLAIPFVAMAVFVVWLPIGMYPKLAASMIAAALLCLVLVALVFKDEATTRLKRNR